MKKMSLLLALVMLMSCIAVPSFAEESVIKESASGFYYIEAEGARPRLSAASADKFIQVDGEWFKDMNGNGTLDVYEDWRADVNDRVNDVLSQMTIQEKAGTLFFSGIGGKNGITVTNLSGDVSGGTTGAAFMQPGLEQMTSHEVVVTVDGVNYSPMAWQVQDLHVTTYIAAMTGMPKDQLDVLNTIQALAEDTRLGIPVVFSGDRVYNTWGGMIDSAHYAYGVARDEELLYNLMSEYAKEAVALGYHQVFHGYGNEIGSWYGDDPNYIAKMSATETHAYEDNGFAAHSKHFIARGGRNSYVNAKSPADLIDSWKVAWQAVVDAGTSYIMTNNNVGVTPGLQGYMDIATYSILRDELGYDGVICLDWPLGITSLMTKTGITTDGVDVSTLSAPERYALILNVGVDMFSALGTVPGTDLEAYDGYGFQLGMPDVLVQAVEEGYVTEEVVNQHVFRVLRNKFEQSIFDNPYRDWEEALALISNGNYTTESPIPMTNEDINSYRRPEIKAMEDELMVKSTIIYKNDNVLPLTADAKIYVDGSTEDIKNKDSEALGAKATVVDTLADATVAVFHVTSFNDAYEFMIEDAKDAGVPVVLIYEGTNSAEPGLQQFIDADALVMQTYRNTPDHGSSVGSFYRYVTPSITAEMLFGEKEPTGKTLFELAYNATDKTISWGELQDDIGVTNQTRLYMAALAQDNPTIEMPNNLGNVIVTDSFGIQYSKPADITLSLLTVDREAVTVETETNGQIRTSTVVQNKVQKAGEPFEICFLARNNGGDGLITVPVLDGETCVAEKIVGVTEGQFRVITVELTLEAGEHTITVGDMSATIVVE